jgi:proton-dependent oligopeptide transporter, POT family
MEQNTSLSDSSQRPSFHDAVSHAFKELGDTVRAFIKAPRALWGVNIPYILEGLVYFGILTILGKYCSENVNLNDVHSGWVYGGVTGGITFAMLLLGGVTDKIGIRFSLALSLGTMAVGRLLISLSGTLSLGKGLGSPMFYFLISGLFLMVCAYGLFMPAAYAGVKRYTNPQTAAIGYAVLYGLMNLGAFIFGPLSSYTRHKAEALFPPNGLTAVFWVLTIITVISCVFTVVIITKRVDRAAVDQIKRETDQMTEGDAAEPKQSGSTARIDNRLFWTLGLFSILALIVFLLSLVHKIPLSNVSAGILLSMALLSAGWEYLRHRQDHPLRDLSFVFFVFIMIPVQTLFAHNWLTIPYYLDRAFAGSWVSEHFEILSNLNPIIIFILAPVVAALTARANVYKMMIIGTFVMAIPAFLLALGPIAILFVIYTILTSIGEAMWQPRFLQWIAEIAPEGKTGAYMGIGQFPWFLTKLITSLYSGYFVAHYIPKPETGLPVKTGVMWFIYAMIAIISPFALLLARKWMMRNIKAKS